MSEISIAIIGCGTVAETLHLPALMKIKKKVKIEALVDVDEDRARSLAQKFGLEDASIYRDYKDAVKNSEVDAVWILTPPSFHAEIALKAIKEEKHALIEKPLATRLEEAMAIRNAVKKINSRRKENKLIIMPAHNFIFTPCFEKTLELLGSNIVGRVKKVTGRTVSNLSFYGAKTDFRLQAKGGAIEDQLPHILYLTIRVAGSFRKILKLEPFIENKPIVEDARLIAEMEKGAIADLSAAWSGSIPTFKIAIIGENGKLIMDLLRKPYTLTIFQGGEQKKVKIGRSLLQYIDVLRGKHPSYFKENIHFLDAIRGEREQLIEVEEGVEVVKVLNEAINLLGNQPLHMKKREKVALIKVDDCDIERALRRSISLVGGLNFERNAHVIIKPNICFWKNTENMIVTDPRVLEAMLKIVGEKTKRITIVESDNNSGTAERRARMTGILNVIEECGAEFFNLSRDRYVEHNILGFEIRIPRTVLEADYFINLPKMKTCNIENAIITIAMKNMFGVIADEKKTRLHKKLVDFILYMNRIVRQDLIVVDGITAMEGLGPIWGTPVQLNLLVSGRNPGAVDAVCCHIMGINPYAVEVLWRAYKEGISEINIERIEILGERLEDVKRKFAYPVFIKKNVIGAIRTALKTYF